MHHKEHNEFERKESSNVEVRHDEVTEDNAVHRDDISVRINTEERGNANITDEQTNPLMSTSPHPVSKPCTDIHNVATQSDPHITEDSSNVSNCSHVLFSFCIGFELTRVTSSRYLP